MYGRVTTVAFQGIEARPVDVEVSIGPGQFVFQIVGLPDKAVGESRERVRHALMAIGISLPWKRITVNLAPGDLPKEGSHYDLPIALALLVAMEALGPDAVAPYVAMGELGLDGMIREVPGALTAAVGAKGLDKGLVCPAAVGPEAAWAAEDMVVVAAPDMMSLLNHFRGRQTLAKPKPNLCAARATVMDLADVKGQESAKRALEVAAAGGHNLLMVGPPGSGKTMLASRLPGILPQLAPSEMLEVSMIHSMAGSLLGGKIVIDRPFRAPHHSATMAALVGGGSKPRPGEVSLAHNGVLFLDELPEFSSHALDALRQPLESGETMIARANHRVMYPSKIQLIAAMNPCKCGGGIGNSCKRGPRCAQDYQAKLSGPLLDRIDLYIEVPAVSVADLSLPKAKEGSAAVRSRVERARNRQAERYAAGATNKTRTNADASAPLVDEFATPDQEGLQLLHQAADRWHLTARGVHRTLRVARTLADLDGSRCVRRQHVAEALSYRREVITAKPV
jgi:magnesium chelatase family protein